MALIPATILTGFLGSGKTTLLKRVLSEAHGQKIAVIENEFGEENIDNEILVADTNEQIIQMSNGCVCCTIREDLRSTLAELAEKRRKGELAFDRVVIETTGLADPGPVAQTFFMDDEIAESYLLDSILTLVDAKHAEGQLDQRQEARRQVGFADQIFISKSELVEPAALDALAHRIKHMNPRAGQRKVHFGEVPISEVFDLKGFNLSATLDIDPDFLSGDGHAKAHDHGHDHGHDHHAHHDHDGHEHGEHCDHPHHHVHDDDVKSFVFRSKRAFNPARREELRLPKQAGLQPRQAGGLPGRHRPGLRPEDVALQGRAEHEGQRPQGRVPGRSSADGQRPRPEVGSGRGQDQQDGLHRHRPPARRASSGPGTVPRLRGAGRARPVATIRAASRVPNPATCPRQCRRIP